MTLAIPLIWVVFPIIIAVLSVLLYKRDALSILLISLTSFALALLAAFFPEDLMLQIGPIELKFIESMTILERQIKIEYELMPLLAFIYGMTGLWALSSGFPNSPVLFRPISLLITALFTAAMGVEPFLYAALLIQTAALVSIPILSSSSKSSDRGVLRFLTLETLAMPLILLAGWLLSGVETLPAESPLISQTTVVLGLGFAIWLGVFPFHSWVPMVSRHSAPNVFSFLLFTAPTVILVFSLNFLDRYTFLRSLENFEPALRFFGTWMIVFGGLWAAFQENLKRVLGFAVLVETGFALLAIGSFQQGGLTWMMMLIPGRALGFWLLGFALTALENRNGELDIASIRGIARRYPFLATGTLVALLSIAGLPLLASFPIKSLLLSTTFSASSSLGIWSFLGSMGLFFVTLRILAAMITPDEDRFFTKWQIGEKPIEYVPILILIVILIAIGLFPHTFLGWITTTLTAFTQLR